jgi:hypothetical protein
MLNFSLHRLHPSLYKFLNNIDINDCIVENSALTFLKNIELEILDYPNDWDNYKKIINPYEYLYSMIPGKNSNLTKNITSSRSYFEAIELLNHFVIAVDRPIKVFLLQKSDGFQEAIEKLYNCSINVATDTNNFVQFKENASLEDLIISTDNCIPYDLLYQNICTSLCIQKKGGTFILKINDISTQFTIDIIALLSSMYMSVYIVKSLTSKCYTSEKYIICQNFIHVNSKEIFPYLLDSLTNILEKKSKRLFLSYHTTNIFMNKIEEYNTILIQYQIENIHSILNLIRSDNMKKKESGSTEIKSKVQYYIKNNIQKCMQWCIENNIDYLLDV